MMGLILHQEITKNTVIMTYSILADNITASNILMLLQATRSRIISNAKFIKCMTKQK